MIHYFIMLSGSIQIVLSRRAFVTTLLLGFLVVACNSPTPTAEPELPPLPSPEVPSIIEIDEALERWKDNGPNDYFLELEERELDKFWKVRVVVTDGLIRSAQRVELEGDGQWGEPFSITRDQAQDYTIESVFQRVRVDALGDGSVLLNLNIVFDQILGYPKIIRAEALPSYNEQGQIELNSQYSYNLTINVKELIENTYGADQQSLYSLTRGGGPDTWCDSLRILIDRTSIYADECQDELLRLVVPDNLLAKLDDLRSNFSILDNVRADGEQFERLVINGTGEGIPDFLTLKNAWDLSAELQDYLTQRIGFGIVLSYLLDGQLFGFDVYNRVSLPSQIAAPGNLRGMSHSLDGNLLAISEDEGFYLENVQTQINTHFLAPLEGGYYAPRALSTNNRLLISSVSEDERDPIQHGWVSLHDQTFHELPVPEGLDGFGCDTGIAWSTDGGRVAIGGLGYGESCNINPGLTIIDLSRGATQSIVSPSILSGVGEESSIIAGVHTPAWSPDDSWIAFGLDQDAIEEFTFPTRLYLVHPDGSQLTQLTENLQGKATHPVWAQDGSLFYGLSGEGEELDGLYQYLPAEKSHILHISGIGIHPLSISPDGEYLLYEQDQQLKIWQLRLEDTVAEINGNEDNNPIFVGWLLTENER